jgi:integrase
MIRERSKGHYEVRVYVGHDPRTGREKYLSRTHRGGIRGARALERTLLGQVSAGKHARTTSTLGELLDAWLDHARPSLSPTTVRGYESAIEARIRPELGTVPLAKLRAVDLDRFYDAATAAGSTAKTVRNYHAILRRALEQAVRWGWIPVNPAVLADPPSVGRHQLQPPSPADVGRLIADAHELDPDFGTLVYLAVVTGARRGELVALQWADWLSGHELLIARSIVAVQGTITVKSTKTDRARRLQLGARTYLALLRHRHDVEQRWAVADALPPKWMFAGPSGEPWHPDTITGRWRRLCDAAGISCRFHDLRHYAATQALAAGIPVRTVSGRLGHANTATTHNVYAHFIEASDRDAADVLEATLH